MKFLVKISFLYFFLIHSFGKANPYFIAANKFEPNPNTNSFEPSSKEERQYVYAYPEELQADYWNEKAQKQLSDKLETHENRRIAKNVIFFIGDGMSVPTIAASRIYKGQKLNQSGEDSTLFFETFPYTGFSKTYCVDKQVTDSASSATAYLCGVKANYGTIGVTAKVQKNDCQMQSIEEYHVDSIAAWAQKAGKSTGIVTTARVTHASPAGNYAHVAHRDYESDADVKALYKYDYDCVDIAKQLIDNEPGKNFNVILGGGKVKFLPKSINETNEHGKGERIDGIDLIAKWKNVRKAANTNYEYVTDRNSLNNVDCNKVDYLLGLFSDSYMAYNLDNDNTEPTLTEMTEAAIKILSKNEKGFYLFVEGGKIDLAHHQNLAHKALDETVELDKAIEAATKMTSREDTLIVVTADHSHVMTFAGYAKRGNNILAVNSEISDVDNKPYTTIAYANGPGYRNTYDNSTLRKDLTNFKFDKNTQYPSGVPLADDTHGGDDVGVFAYGPWAHLFTGVYEQNAIPHLMAYASCIGRGKTAC